MSATPTTVSREAGNRIRISPHSRRVAPLIFAGWLNDPNVASGLS
jgi:hypothetical protein